MKIIKRNGRVVDYDREKIKIAIEKANKEVRQSERATIEDIDKIIEYIEEFGKKRMLVEDIQDIIEEKLMEIGKFELSKKYIVYRYTRALVRKQNTTDESILGFIRNENKEAIAGNSSKNIILASTQRDYIAGEVSRDLTKRLLLPEKIVKAHDEGILYFHDAQYFVQPIFNSCLVNIGDMLDNGTVINGKIIESPKSFQVACIVTTQIITTVASNQYGEQSIDLIHLGKYLRKSYDKYKKEMQEKYKGKIKEEQIEEIIQDRLKTELKAGVQAIYYQINTSMTTNGKIPFVTLFLHLDENDTYIKENVMIIEEVLKQRLDGIKNDKKVNEIPDFPKLVYVLDECNNLTGGKYDYLTKLAVKCDYISAKKMREDYQGNIFSPMGCKSLLSLWKDEKGNYKFEGRFNQGVVSINLPQIGIIANGKEELFWKEFDERLELCKEALMCRHYALLGTKSDISPIHWQYGAIARLKKGETIDNLLYGGYSTISLGYIGLYELTKLMTGELHTTEKEQQFTAKVMKHLKETVEKWKKETNIGFVLYETTKKDICCKFANIDKEKFGTIKDITDKGYYTNSNDVGIPNVDKNIEELEKVVKFIYNNVLYSEFKKGRD